MPVKKDSSGRRYVQSEVEVPGSPDEVWQAIATGPGISSWFVPSAVDGRVGGITRANFGPGMESEATITAWDPPRRFEAESRDMGPAGPVVATEWTVEARAGGTSVVRVVHSWFSDSDEWDEQFSAFEAGWVDFFRILRLYLARYRGTFGVGIQSMGMTSAPVADAWKTLVEPLGLNEAKAGQLVNGDHVPSFRGRVEFVGPVEFPQLLLTIDAPAPGVAHLFAMNMGEQSCVSARLYFYGNAAHVVAAAEEPKWQTMMASRFTS